MKARTIHTKFYDSERVLNLSKNARWLFMYYLTCKGIGLTGAFKWSESKTRFETALNSKEISIAAKELEQNGLVFFHENWIVVPETENKTNFDKGKMTSVAFKKELEELPEVVRSLLIPYQYPINTLLEKDDRVSIPLEISNKKLEISNKKEKGIVKGENIYSSLSDVGEQEIRDIADGYQVPESFVRSKLEDLENYCTGHGRVYKNYLAALKQWVKKDAISVRKEHSGKSKIAFIDE